MAGDTLDLWPVLAAARFFARKESVTEIKSPSEAPSRVESARPRQVIWFAWFSVGLTLVFARPLFGLLRFALAHGLHSYIVIIPLIAAYFVWLRRKGPLPQPASSFALAVVPCVLGLLALKEIWGPLAGSPVANPSDYYALATFGYLCLLWMGALLLLGGRFLREFSFPAAFLIFFVPMPEIVENALEIFFQHTSAEMSAVLFNLSGLSYYRDAADKLVFHLPGISIRVAQECSGIRSSVVLFITSLLAGYLFLRSPRRRLVLALIVIPLAILRNGFRIFTIGMLCVHISPDMIDSPIHHRGGPLFFALSLIPFFGILFWLRRGDLRSGPTDQAEPAS